MENARRSEVEFTQQTLHCLRAPFCVAKEMGALLAGNHDLFGCLSTRPQTRAAPVEGRLTKNRPSSTKRNPVSE